MAKSIIVPESVTKEKEGVVILPLKKWKEIEESLEDLEMLRSINLAKEIAKRRKSKKVIPLENLLKKYRT